MDLMLRDNIAGPQEETDFRKIINSSLLKLYNHIETRISLTIPKKLSNHSLVLILDELIDGKLEVLVTKDKGTDFILTIS